MWDRIKETVYLQLAVLFGFILGVIAMSIK
jgi:hypothetical protein